MKINPKSEKGAITLVVLTGMLLLTVFLMSMYIQMSNRAQGTAETTKKIAQRYNNLDKAEVIYNSYFADTNIIPIYTREHLEKIGSDEQVLINSKVYTFSKDGNYVIQNDLNLGGIYDEETDTWSGEQWEPLTEEFIGTLDGLGYTIRGIYIDNAEAENQGLFSKLNGTVKNLRIVDGYLNAKTYVGAIAGWNGLTTGDGTQGIIENCYSEIEVVGNNMLAGGICGLNNNIIRNSCSKSTLTGNCTGIGGIAGQNNGIGIIANCYNMGSINNSGQYAGGVSGTNVGTIIDSYNIGNVKGTRYIGGIVGAGRKNLRSCYNKGTIEGNSEVGGILGYSMGNAKISNSYNIGEVIGTSNVGKILGYAGYSSDNIQYCYYLGTSDDKTVGGGSGKVTDCLPKSETELKAIDTTNTDNIINLLNVELETPVWVADTENKNEGYPILYWQK